MLQNKFIIALAFVTTIMWGCTSGAMFEGFKNYVSKIFPSAAYLIGKKTETPQTIKPFASDEEKKQSFRTLKALEDWQPYMVDYDENYSISKAIQAIEEIEHPDNVVAFLERLARDVVKHDIKNKEPYTIALGLKLETDGTISMKRSPCSNTTLQNTLLFRLSIDPTDDDAREALKKLYKNDKNPSGNAAGLFPKLVPLTDDKMDEFKGATTEAGYQKSSNAVYLRHSSLEDICKITRTALHELTHFRQWLQGAEVFGGVKANSLTPQYRNTRIPSEVANELEAEKQSVDLYPDKELYVKSLEKKIEKNGEIIEILNAFNFPYLTPGQCYLKMLKNLGVGGKPNCIALVKDSAELRKNTKKLSKCGGVSLGAMFPKYEELTQKLQPFYDIIEVMIRQQEITHALGHLKWSLIPTIVLTKAPIHAGSKEFFDIKCKILKELDEEEKRAEKISPSTVISKNFENKN